MFYQCHTTTMQSQDANTGLISNLTILSSIHYPLPSSTYTLAHYHHSQLCSSDLLFLSIKHPSIYFFITPFTHNLYAYICNIYDSNLHAYICSHLSNPVFCQFTHHPSIHLSIYLHLFTPTSIQVHRFIHNYIYSFRHSSIHPQSHSSKISPFCLSWICSSFLLIQILIQPGCQFIQSQIAL